jgi:hypothetical protein
MGYSSTIESTWFVFTIAILVETAESFNTALCLLLKVDTTLVLLYSGLWQTVHFEVLEKKSAGEASCLPRRVQGALRSIRGWVHVGRLPDHEGLYGKRAKNIGILGHIVEAYDAGGDAALSGPNLLGGGM